MSLNIIEVLGRSEQGVTRPFICRCDDGCIYFVKGLDSNRESQIKEWVVGSLASDLGLPVAPFSLVYADAALTRLSVCEGLGEGYSFGSRKIQVTELTYPNIRHVPLGACPRTGNSSSVFCCFKFPKKANFVSSSKLIAF